MRAMSGAPAAVVLVFACAIAATPARADPYFTEVGIGGLTLTKTNAISMDSEDLYISRDIVRGKFRFTNTTDSPIDALVAFPLPDIPPPSPDIEENISFWSEPSELKFKASLDGKPLALRFVEQAFFKGRDVSARLSALHIPPNRIAKDFDADIGHLPEAERGGLAADGLIHHNNHLGWLALWTLRTTVTSHQTFPPRKTITAEYEYAPRVGGGDHGVSLSPEERRKYCIDDAWVRTLDKKVDGYDGETPGITIGYVLTTGANWKGPIGDFRLVVDKGEPDSLVSFCAEGIKQILPTQCEVRHTNFTPKEDLNIAIIDFDGGH